MPTRNVNLTDQLDRFIAARVKRGKYANASDVVRAGLRALQREEALEALKLKRLKALIAEGDRSGIEEDYSFEKLMAESDAEFAVRRRRTR